MTLVIIQARTSSSRLPGKVLLPINGIPMAVLAALRAGNTGIKVLLATSNEASDDVLCSYAEEYGIPVFRGSLNDVLGRFADIVAPLDDDAPVVRLTADNPVPDGTLIEEVVNYFNSEHLDYLRTNGIESGLPYGVSVEVIRAWLIKKSNSYAISKHDREHVTSWARSNVEDRIFKKYEYLNLADVSATVDTLDDYLKVSSLFKSFQDACSTHWGELAEDLARKERGRITTLPKFVLGAAQLGMQYGITNDVPFVEHDALQMLEYAVDQGVAVVDTARSYGKSEAIIGAFRKTRQDSSLAICTKLDPLAALCRLNTDDVEVVEALVEHSVWKSMATLATERLDTLMLHRASQLSSWSGVVWSRLRAFRACAQIGRLGVSVQSPEELLLALSFDDVEHIQIPANLLDHRWDNVIRELRAARSKRKITVHVRSSLLQGLLVSDNAETWRKAQCGDATPVLNWLGEVRRKTDRGSIADLCFAWARAQDWADAVVVGSNSKAQLMETIELFKEPHLTVKQLEYINDTRPMLPAQTLNPAMWS
ncbi:aldo/keto reductase [Roseibium sp. SCP14]|uniref:aldo/keto reductase n=1 Tax=Roseibium sp. SCP14 TaxID=3141375 RepID=UPI00333DAE1B